MSWLVLTYNPINLFSLKQSNASSKYGASHFIPTPYAIKVAFIEAGYRKGGEIDARRAFENVKSAEIRIKPSKNIVVQSQTIKVLQPSRKEVPLDQTVVMREYCYLDEPIKIALRLNPKEAKTVKEFAPYIRYFGKKDSMVQFSAFSTQENLSDGYTIHLKDKKIINSGTVVSLDDFTEKSSHVTNLFERVNVYSPAKLLVGDHRETTPHLIPVLAKQQGANFTLYKREN